jgi:thiol-disulfide isomerase/thioredoxin
MYFLRIILLTGMISGTFPGFAQKIQPGNWLFTLTREGGIPVFVMAELSKKEDGLNITFINGSERLQVEKTGMQGDSLIFSMPFFETDFGLKVQSESKLSGIMTKGISSGTQVWQVVADFDPGQRIPQANGNAAVNISGRWAMEFQRPDGSWRPAVAEWKQSGNKVTGTIINPSGDYRFLEGAVWQNNMYVTAFDGAHIYAFQATINNDSIMEHGRFFTGNPPGVAFRAKKNANATLPELAPVTGLKPGANMLNFRFPDTDSNFVSISDPRFQNKVVVVQLMGSWCPNCMDETKFLSEYYNAQNSKEVEMVSLAYELSSDFNRSALTLRKFKNRFGVQYPMLITGARSADADKAAKTLPQLTDIQYFPTTLFLDKKGNVRKIHNGFYGPGAPEYFKGYKKDFYEIIELLKNE